MTEESRVDKFAVEEAVRVLTLEKDEFTVSELRDQLKNQGYVFGNRDELLDNAEKQKTRFFLGRLTDKFGKRKFVATKRQMSMDFGNEYIYCPAAYVKKESFEEKHNLGWLRKHMTSLVKRTPLLPQWAIEEIISSINRVFEKINKVA